MMRRRWPMPAERSRCPICRRPSRRSGSHLVPTERGNAVQMLIHGPDEELLTLFAVETDSFNIEPPHAEAVRDVNVAYWQSGWVAYVLSGTGDQKELLSLASRLSR